MSTDNTSTPQFRATLSDGRLVLECWDPRLFHAGPAACMMRAIAGPPIADLAIAQNELGYNELIVTEVTDAGTPEFVDAICKWAASLAYCRVWFPHDVVALSGFDAGSVPGVLATTCCRTCGATWEDDSLGFWVSSRAAGFFPLGCPRCGATLPQWSVIAGEDTRPTGDARDPHDSVYAREEEVDVQ